MRALNDCPRAEGSKAGTSARCEEVLWEERRKGDGCALLVVEMEGEVVSWDSHSSLQ